MSLGEFEKVFEFLKTWGKSVAVTNQRRDFAIERNTKSDDVWEKTNVAEIVNQTAASLQLVESLEHMDHLDDIQEVSQRQWPVESVQAAVNSTPKRRRRRPRTQSDPEGFNAASMGKSSKGSRRRSASVDQLSGFMSTHGTRSDALFPASSSSSLKPSKSKYQSQSSSSTSPSNNNVLFPFNSALSAFTSQSQPLLAHRNNARHVFVDHSNIYVGWKDYVRQWRAKNGASDSKIHMNYKGFLDLLCGNHISGTVKVAKKVVVGSLPLEPPNLEETLYQEGCQVFTLHRVQKPKKLLIEDTSLEDEDLMNDQILSMQSLSFTEQGVDELLTLKIYDSLLDFQASPGTLILATGDGNMGEFGGFGFISCVSRALQRGWKVEMWSWRRNMSANYKRFFKNVRGFEICYLDDYLDRIVSIEHRENRKMK